jgi:hypothetical protein
VLHPDVHEIELAPADARIDPELQVTTAPFATWVGNIRVDARSVASILRRSGDEDFVETPADIAAAIEAAFDADSSQHGGRERHLVGTWLPMRTLIPMLDHLSEPEAFDICTRIADPRVEQEPVGPGMAAVMFVVRAARLDGVPGWCAALPEHPADTPAE